MTWKSYAAVSGATVLAGWLASSPVSNTPTGTAASSRPSSPRRGATPGSDIEQQATRLQARLRAVRAYTEPQRNPFRFAARAEAASTGREVDSVVELPPPVDLPPAAPQVSVAGIAEEQTDGRVERTAILSSPAGVLLVREGEEVLGYYRVTRIDSEAVELVGLSDGTATRLTLGASQ